MTENTARRIANLALVAAAAGAGVVVIRTPALRRLAWGLAVTAFTVGLPGWLSREVSEAWAASAAHSGTD